MPILTLEKVEGGRKTLAPHPLIRGEAMHEHICIECDDETDCEGDEKDCPLPRITTCYLCRRRYVTDAELEA